MIEKMSKMTADQQRSFVQQQQVQILSSAFRAQPPAPIPPQSSTPAKPLGLAHNKNTESALSPKSQVKRITCYTTYD